MAQASRTIPAAGIAKALPAITALVAVAFAVAAYALLFVPNIGRLVTGGELDVSSYEARVVETRAYAEKLKAAAASYQAVNPERRERVQNIVTAAPDVPGLYVQMDALAQAHGLVLMSIDAAPEEKPPTTDGRKTVRVAANVVGATYPQLKLFLADLERSERVLDVQSVVFTAASGNYSIVLRAYYLDPEQGTAVVPVASGERSKG